MGIDRRNYVMTAEIAMAREMAFKNKLQSVSCESSSSKDPLHSQLPTATTYLPQTLGPGMPPGAMPPPFSRACTGPGRVWSPTVSADQIPMTNPTWRAMNLTDHKKKGPVNNNNKPVQLGSFFCLVCQIDCTTSYNLMMHYKGQRHMAKLLGRSVDPKGKKVAGGSGLSTAKERLYCKLCGIWCKDEFTFKCHLQCKNHILTHQEYEKNIKRPRH